MSQTQTRDVDLNEAFRMEFERPAAAAQPLVPQGYQPISGSRTDSALAEIITAQRVAVKRDLAAILQEGRVLAAAAGEKFFYRIPFRDNRAGTTTYVEGASIQCAMAAVSVYGNCRLEAAILETTPTHWTIAARFIDYEKGVTIVRPYQQRRSQNTGMKDGGRAEDLIFQIGASKAIRNVVTAALPWLCDEMEAEAKQGIVAKIGKNPAGFRDRLLKRFDEMDIDIKLVERVIGRAADKWLAPDMAKLIVQIQTIQDGMANKEDLFPSSAAEAAELADAPDKPKPTPEPTEAPKATRAPRKAAAPEPTQGPTPAPTPKPTPPPAAPEPEPADDGPEFDGEPAEDEPNVEFQ